MQRLTNYIFNEADEGGGKDPVKKLLSDQMLGYVCEFALMDAISGKSIPDNLDSWAADHKALTNAWNSVVDLQTMGNRAQQTHATKALDVFENFVRKTYVITNDVLNTRVLYKKQETTNRVLAGSDVLSSATGGTAEFDVETDKANIHVKLNQSSSGQRVFGFSAGTLFSDLFFSSVDAIMQSKTVRNATIKAIMADGANKKLNNQAAAEEAYRVYTNGGFPRKPTDMHGAPEKSHPFAVVKRAVKIAFKNNFRLLSKLNFEAEINKDMRTRLFSPMEGKTTAFAKYTCNKSANGFPEIDTLALDFDIYVLPTAIILQTKFVAGAGEKQPYGIVWDKDDPAGEERPLFYIEIRTDGEGHPPQLKIGDVAKLKALASTKPIKTSKP
jgi:hypothetical protein